MTAARRRLAILAALALSAAPSPRASSPGTCSARHPVACDFVWIDANGRPSSAAYDALVLLDNADADGLNPGDYAAGSLRVRAETLAAVTGLTEEAMRFDADVGAAMGRFLRDLHAGRVDPRAMGAPELGEPDDPDYAGLLRAAALGGRLCALVDSLTPAGVQYVAIRRELARYRDLARRFGDGHAALSRLPPLAPGASGDLAALRAWLIATGDLRPDSPARPSEYAGAIVDAIRQFQNRHGLRPDGIIGPATVKALSTPIATRTRQLELSLERLRWLRGLEPGPLVVINIPMFRLWAWDRPDGRTPPQVSMKAVVGRAVANQTHILMETMTHVVLGPFWNVPHSIVVDEILPLVARDALYLDRAHMEIVEGGSDEATVVPPTAANLARLRAGILRLRQRPGPDNALGSIKFVFPNKYRLVIHGTSAPALFAEPRRDLSHGCIRVEDPVALAAWTLQGLDEWSAGAIARAAPTAVSRRIDLPRPVRVLVYYMTAAVVPNDGLLHFSEDIYGRDRALDRALRHR
jgi:murein L,D-transpeptidase YcbB/YkuD